MKKLFLMALSLFVPTSANLFAMATLTPSTGTNCQSVDLDDPTKPIIYAIQAIQSAISATTDQTKINDLKDAGIKLSSDQPNPTNFFNCIPALRGNISSGPINTAKQYLQEGITQLGTATGPRYQNLEAALNILNKYNN